MFCAKVYHACNLISESSGKVIDFFFFYLNQVHDDINWADFLILSLSHTHTQDYVPSDGVTTETWEVSSVSELFQVHVNFLRGKVSLLLASVPVCP